MPEFSKMADAEGELKGYILYRDGITLMLLIKIFDTVI